MSEYCLKTKSDLDEGQVVANEGDVGDSGAECLVAGVVQVTGTQTAAGASSKGTGEQFQEKKEKNCEGPRQIQHFTGIIWTRKREGSRKRDNGQDMEKKLERRNEADTAIRRRRTVTVDSSKAKTSLDALKISLKQLRWKEFPLGRRLGCDIYWHGVSFHDNENIGFGLVNKFPGMTEMVRKIMLSRAVRVMQDLFPEEYSFYPRAWILPEELPLFTAQVHMVKEKDASWRPTFIVKPDGGSQGDGIYLIRDPSEIQMLGSLQSRPAVVQEYISKPLLIDRLKFDIRLYVLLKSLEPLEVYIAKDGLTRFCTEPYQEPNQKNLHNIFMHLTNYSLNIHSANFIHSESVSTGSKRTFTSILYKLASKGIDIKKVWSDIISLVIKTVIALAGELKVYYQAEIPPGKPGPSCFQILGFDILLMKNLKPVLLEVNANPSMRIEHEHEISPGVFEYVPSPVDEDVKVTVIRDTLRLVDPSKRKNNFNHILNQSCCCPFAFACNCYLDLEILPYLWSLLNQRSLQSDHLSETAKEEILDETPSSIQEQDAEVKRENSLPSLCLKQVFPKYAKQFSYLRIVERITDLFIRFLGIKETTKLGSTGFRTFIRCCKLSNSNLSMASVDILYIDITRRWSSTGYDQREPGMCLQAFIEAFIYLARRRFKSLPLHEQVTMLVDLCECHLETLDEKRTADSRGAAEHRALCGSSHPQGRHTAQSAHVHLLHRTGTTNKLTDYKLHYP